MAKSQKKRDIPAGAVAIATNRVARRDYDILDTLEVGIQLHGSEVKSLREAKVQLADSFAIVFQNELWMISGMT